MKKILGLNYLLYKNEPFVIFKEVINYFAINIMPFMIYSGWVDIRLKNYPRGREEIWSDDDDHDQFSEKSNWNENQMPVDFMEH